jgi:hypothetical protein
MEEKMMTTEEVAALASISKRTLLRMIAEAPVGLPGGPIRVGIGRRRSMYRWPSAWLQWFREVERLLGEPRTDSRLQPLPVGRPLKKSGPRTSKPSLYSEAVKAPQIRR